MNKYLTNENANKRLQTLKNHHTSSGQLSLFAFVTNRIEKELLNDYLSYRGRDTIQKKRLRNTYIQYIQRIPIKELGEIRYFRKNRNKWNPRNGGNDIENSFLKLYNLQNLQRVEKATENFRMQMINTTQEYHNILNKIAENFGNIVQYIGTIDATARDQNTTELDIRYKVKSIQIFMISLDLGGVGHWCAGVFDNRTKDKHIYIYDSMQDIQNGASAYTGHFQRIIYDVFGKKIKLIVSGCEPQCQVRRPTIFSRQPTGGFTHITLLPNTRLTDNQIQHISSYESQHHFCYGEAMLFICEKLFHLIENKTWRNEQCFLNKSKHPLYVIKRFLYLISKRYSNIRMPNNFKLIYNHNKRSLENIFQDINANNAKSMSLHSIIDVAYGKNNQPKTAIIPGKRRLRKGV